jgi:diadenylate cyclase
VTRIWEQLQFLRPGWTDLIEILIVAFLLYRILLVIQRTRAMQIMLGVVLLAFTYGLARLLDLILVRTLLETAFQYGAIAALVVFQPELRAALARLGQNRMVRAFQRLEGSKVADEIVEATELLARARHGAIIAIEQEVGLGEYAETGSPSKRPCLPRCSSRSSRPMGRCTTARC